MNNRNARGRRLYTKTCHDCGQKFTYMDWPYHSGQRKYCNLRCWSHAMHRRPLALRFAAKVCVTDGCWEWIGQRNPKGYGIVTDSRRNYLAHRIAWKLAFGADVPAGVLVCHHCDNPACVRPDHLFLGTIADNNRDMHAKGRYGRPGRKLSDEQVRDVYVSVQTTKATQAEMARKYGMSPGAIHGIVHGYRWRAITNGVTER